VFIGHALLAFALATLIADWRGWSARDALTLGVVAGSFAAIPDVDVAYAAIALDVSRLTVESATQPGVFWDATRGVHRSITHSLVVAMVAGPAFGLWAATWERSPVLRAVGRIVAATVLTTLVAAAYIVSGPTGGIVVGTFVLAGLVVASLSQARTSLSGRTVGLTATAGLLSHPWGDLVTGEPPRLFYPLDVQFLDGTVLLHGDPTVHLLGAFAIELAVFWFTAVTITRVTGRSWTTFLDRRAGIGILYGVTALVMTPPTLEVSYHFVFSIVAVGLACGGLVALSGSMPTVATLDRRIFRSRSPLGIAFTSLGGVTTALISYGTVYTLFAA
jgi:membrane-bound metal-dependent hydrolase YbcI (DUF457 family)